MPRADRRYSVASGNEICALSVYANKTLTANSDIASAKAKVPFKCASLVIVICDLAIALSQ